MTFHFAYPVVLLLTLAAIGWVVLALKRRPAGITHSEASLLARLGRDRWSRTTRLPVLLRGACLLLLVLTAARPQLYNVSRDIRSPGVDIMLCIDTSGSMQALDFTLDGEPVSRLTAVKKVVNDFIRKREMDRIGLIVFGQEAFTQSPLTLDKGLLLGLVEKMEIGMAGDRTAVGSAIAVAGKRLKDIPAKSKLMILLTDGRNNEGSLTPEQAAEAVSALGIRIYTIGVGGTEPAPFKVQTVFGPKIVRQQVDLDEDTLKKVATIGKGRYFRASESTRLAEIYDIIDKAEKTEVKVKEFFHFKELYPYFLIPALCLFIMEAVLRATILRVFP